MRPINIRKVCGAVCYSEDKEESIDRNSCKETIKPAISNLWCHDSKESKNHYGTYTTLVAARSSGAKKLRNESCCVDTYDNKNSFKNSQEFSSKSIYQLGKSKVGGSKAASPLEIVFERALRFAAI